MDMVYLENGQACYLKEKIGDKYIVNRIFEYPVYYGDEERTEMFEDSCDVVVDKIFDGPPTQKIADEVKKLLTKKVEIEKENQKLRDENRNLKYENEQITKTQINQQKFIINKTELINATTLALFPKDSIMPKVLNSDKKNFRGLKISMEATITESGERYWGYNLYFEDNWASSDFLCPKYGILINPTEEQIDEVIKKRLIEFKFADYKIAHVPDKYLSEEQLKVKKAYLLESANKDRIKLEKEIKEKQDYLQSLIQKQEQLNNIE